MIQKNLQAQLDDLEDRMRALEDRIAAAEERPGGSGWTDGPIHLLKCLTRGHRIISTLMARDDQQANDIRALKQYVKYPTDDDLVAIGWRPHTKMAHEIEDDIGATQVIVTTMPTDWTK